MSAATIAASLLVTLLFELANMHIGFPNFLPGSALEAEHGLNLPSFISRWQIDKVTHNRRRRMAATRNVGFPNHVLRFEPERVSARLRVLSDIERRVSKKSHPGGNPRSDLLFKKGLSGRDRQGEHGRALACFGDPYEDPGRGR